MKKHLNTFCSNNILLIVLMLCVMTLSSCSDTNISKEEIRVTCQEIIANANNEQEMDTVYNYDKDISIQHANGELIRQYMPSKIIDISSPQANEKTILIMLSSKTAVMNLTIAELKLVQGNFELGDTIYENKEMSHEEAIFIKISIASKMGFKSVSYINTEGKRTNLFLHMKETDGSLFIGEYYQHEPVAEE